MVVFGQKWLYSGKVDVFGESGCIREKNGCIRAKKVVFVKSGCIPANLVVFG